MGWIQTSREKNHKISQEFKLQHPEYDELIQFHWNEQIKGISRYLKIVSFIFIATLLLPLFGFFYSTAIGAFLLIFPIATAIYIIYRVLFILQAIETFYSTEEVLILQKSVFGNCKTQKWDRMEFEYIIAVMHGKASGKPRWEFILSIGDEPERDPINYFLTIPSAQSSKGDEFIAKLLENKYKLMIVHYEVTTLCGTCITYLDGYQKDTELECTTCETIIEFR